MSDIVFILGAGASRMAGGPLMSDFLSSSDDLLRAGRVDDKREDFERVSKAIGKLRYVHSKSNLNTANIEDVFSAFEMAKIIEKFSEFNLEEIDKLISSTKRVIAKTLESKIEFPTNGETVLSPKPYDELLALIRFLREEASPRHSVALITFNYDIALDYAIYKNGCEASYFLEDLVAIDITIPFFKLHGSLNWTICPGCDRIVLLSFDEYQNFRDIRTYKKPEKEHLPISMALAKFRHCENHQVNPDPVLIPPTWNKIYHQQHFKQLSLVWKQAAIELSEAQHLFVIGYSLPETDGFFRALYSLGTESDRSLRRFWVFDPDETVEKRFRKLLGSQAENVFEYRKEEFENAIRILNQTFGNKPRLNPPVAVVVEPPEDAYLKNRFGFKRPKL